MKEQIVLQNILVARYEEMRIKNPHFSRRAFSKRLGISAGAISELFNGKRQVSLALAKRIVERLNLDPQERAELFAAFPKKRIHISKEKRDEVDPTYLQLSVDQFNVVGDWYHFAILTLMRSKDFKSKPEWIANRLALSTSTVVTALQRLKRLGIIKEEASGKLTRSKTRYRTSDDVANISVRKAHSQYLEKSREALEKVPVAERDFTSLMMSIEPEHLMQIKERIRKFQDDLSSEFETKPHSEVYQLCMQLFPLTKKEELK